MPIDDNELNKIAKFRLPTPIAPLCPQCGYNLTGLENPQCPECGYRFNWQAVRKKARQQWLEALGLKTLPEEVEFGFRLAGIGWGVAVVVTLGVVLMRVIGELSFTLSTFFLVLRVIQVILAFCGLFLCGHVIKFRRLPEEAQEALRIEVPLTKAWTGFLASAGLLLISPATFCIVG